MGDRLGVLTEGLAGPAGVLEEVPFSVIGEERLNGGFSAGIVLDFDEETDVVESKGNRRRVASESGFEPGPGQVKILPVQILDPDDAGKDRGVRRRLGNGQDPGPLQDRQGGDQELFFRRDLRSAGGVLDGNAEGIVGGRPAGHGEGFENIRRVRVIGDVFCHGLVDLRAVFRFPDDGVLDESAAEDFGGDVLKLEKGVEGFSGKELVARRGRQLKPAEDEGLSLSAEFGGQVEPV